MQTHITTKPVVMPVAIALLLAASAGRPHGELLFPWFNETKANDLIHRAAVTFGWPAGLQFDGCHCLRHGGCQAVKAFIARVLAAAGPIVGMGSGTIPTYARLNEVRLELERDELSDSDDDE